MTATMEGIGSQGVTDEEVDRAKQQILKARRTSGRQHQPVRPGDDSMDRNGEIGACTSSIAIESRRLLRRKSKTQPPKYLVPNNRTVGISFRQRSPTELQCPRIPISNRSSTTTWAQVDLRRRNLRCHARKYRSPVKRLDLPGGIKATLLPKRRGATAEVHCF